MFIQKKRKLNYKKGLFTECLAIFYLIIKGYRILSWRYKAKSGEIDIIAKRGKRLAFIEVKTRQDLEIALGALTWRQERRIVNSSKYWLSKNVYYNKFNIQYDYIVFIPWRFPFHYQNYFHE